MWLPQDKGLGGGEEEELQVLLLLRILITDGDFLLTKTHT